MCLHILLIFGLDEGPLLAFDEPASSRVLRVSFGLSQEQLFRRRLQVLLATVFREKVLENLVFLVLTVNILILFFLFLF